MTEPKILHLTLKKKWFDMIASGDKKEEYREIKPYWDKRLFGDYNDCEEYFVFDVVEFRNGYGKNKPSVTVECEAIIRGEGRPEWGAEPGKEYYVIKLGNIISINNYQP